MLEMVFVEIGGQRNFGKLVRCNSWPTLRYDFVLMLAANLNL